MGSDACKWKPRRVPDNSAQVRSAYSFRSIWGGWDEVVGHGTGWQRVGRDAGGWVDAVTYVRVREEGHEVATCGVEHRHRRPL